MAGHHYTVHQQLRQEALGQLQNEMALHNLQQAPYKYSQSFLQSLFMQN